MQKIGITPEKIGRKAYGLAVFSQLQLFKRPFLFIESDKDEKAILQALKENNIQEKEELAIRFSQSKNSMNLPFFLGRFSHKEIAKTIISERKWGIAIVHGLVKTKFSASLYYDGNIFLIEVWPWIGASKKTIFNIPSDIILIEKNKITISRYLKNRKVENVSWEEVDSIPFEKDFLLQFAKKIIEVKNPINKISQLHTPLLCDINCENLEDINFMGMQTGETLNKDEILKTIHTHTNEEYYIVTSLEELKNYSWKGNLFFDIPLARGYDKRDEIIELLKLFPEVYLRSLTMHLAVVLREFWVTVKKANIKNEYEKSEIILE